MEIYLCSLATVFVVMIGFYLHKINENLKYIRDLGILVNVHRRLTNFLTKRHLEDIKED